MPEHGLPIWPWLLAAVALGAGGAFFLWRRNSREAYVGGPSADFYAAPESAPVPPAAPPVPRAAPKSAPLKPVGVVSTRLRPWIEIGFEPQRCIVEDERVTFEFEVSLFNSGSVPARDVLIEAVMFNASPTQDHEIDGFFGKPVGQGERIPAIPPLQRVNLRPKVVVGRNQIRVLEAGGRKVFVPLLAFNSLYRWGQSNGQTSSAYLLGRDSKSDKMAPFRIDLGPRVFRGLKSTPLPVAVRK